MLAVRLYLSVESRVIYHTTTVRTNNIANSIDSRQYIIHQCSNGEKNVLTLELSVAGIFYATFKDFAGEPKLPFKQLSPEKKASTDLAD